MCEAQKGALIHIEHFLNNKGNRGKEKISSILAENDLLSITNSILFYPAEHKFLHIFQEISTLNITLLQIVSYIYLEKNRIRYSG